MTEYLGHDDTAELVDRISAAICRTHPFPLRDMTFGRRLRLWWLAVRHPFAFVDQSVQLAGPHFAVSTLLAIEEAGYSLVRHDAAPQQQEGR